MGIPAAFQEVRLVTFEARLAPAFARLNLEWIESLFEVEPRDRETLDHPQKTVLDRGGEIFFVLENGAPVGTVALVSVAHGYELEKMAVTESARGRGHGDRLLQAAIEWARARGASRVTLYSNRSLEPAIRLYRKHGFREIPMESFADWKRSNIHMQLDLDRRGALGRGRK
jgi:GNAT superfamily N-acetyltransferase